MPIFYQMDYKTQQAELGLDYSPPQADLNEVTFIIWECKWENESGSSPQQSGWQVGLPPFTGTGQRNSEVEQSPF